MINVLSETEELMFISDVQLNLPSSMLTGVLLVAAISKGLNIVSAIKVSFLILLLALLFDTSVVRLCALISYA